MNKFISKDLAEAIKSDTEAITVVFDRYNKRENDEMVILHHDIDVLTKAINELGIESVAADLFDQRQKLLLMYKSLIK